MGRSWALRYLLRRLERLSLLTNFLTPNWMISLSGKTSGEMRFAGGLALDADEGPEPGDAAGEARMLGGGNDRVHVLVGAGGFLGHAAMRWGPNQNPGRSEIIDHLAAAPLLERRVAR